ncbi:MAG: gluconolactonase, partial [Acetatifactor sp.]|nr:gluconolactonase [Acetatifactor sp.]
LANTGIGKAYLTAGDYEQAMKYLKLGMNRDHYSVAFRRYRNDMLTANASYFLTGIAVLLIVWFVYKQWKKKKGKKGGAANG